MNKLLSNQLRRAFGLRNISELDQVLAEAGDLAKSPGTPPAVSRLLLNLRDLMNRVNDSYDHYEHDLDLRVRSLQLSSDELQEVNRKLLQASRTDSLSGLWNRGYWQERVQEEFLRAQRFGQPVSLVMMDIDHFKQVNDTYGHPFGDEVIRGICKMLQDSTRHQIDVRGRYGGEEFVIILPLTNVAGGLRLGDHIRQRVEQLKFQADAVTVLVTISAGVSELDHASDTVESWVKHADQALYQAKAAGRNQVCIYERESHTAGQDMAPAL